MQVKGELVGEINLDIEGRVEGRVVVQNHDVTVASGGRIEAEVVARSVLVLGRVLGDITASERVEIAPSGSVQGDIRAPRVTLADGSSFSGSINKTPAAPDRRPQDPSPGRESPQATTDSAPAAPRASRPGPELVDRRGKNRPWSEPAPPEPTTPLTTA
jgi:cytoskeletal protein CcmA (bactofilin family)